MKSTNAALVPRSQSLVHQVFELCAPNDFLSETADAFHQVGIQAAVASSDTPTLVDWLLQAFSFQGISDVIAQGYMDAHGCASSSDVSEALRAHPCCPKLHGFSSFQGCGYTKSALTCAEPTHLPSCPLPLMPLRNGRLNQIAYALVLFARDVCNGDLVSWIDHQLEQADDPTRPGRVQRMRAALLEPLSRIEGISNKVLSMILSDLLLCGDPERERWTTTGASMIAVDNLVHNWMHRTGILHDHGAEHAYGSRCYAPGGCADLIEEAAQTIDARVLNPGYPAVFPRLMQVAIWSFCAERGFDFCNGNRIDDRAPCQRQACVFWDQCQHVPLRPPK